MPAADNLPATGFLRLNSILAPNGPIPVSKSTWWEGIKSGRYPKPLKLGPRITVWRVEDIRGLIEEGACAQALPQMHLRAATPGKEESNNDDGDAL